MGAGDVSGAVADAGPLIHLSEIGGLPLLLVFDALHVPDAVWRETVERGRVPDAGLLDLGTIQRHTLLPSDVSVFSQQNAFEALQEGEREALCLCRQIGMPLLLTDDLAVREASKSIAVTPVGSLGIVARAYQTGRLSLAEAERCMRELYDTSSLFVTQAIVELAIEQLRSHVSQS